MASVLVVVPQDSFRDEELFETRDAIVAAGHTVVLASHSPGLCCGTKGGTAIATTSIDSIDDVSPDAVVFIGGPGARSFFTCSAAHRIAREAHHAGKIVGAICVAPVILANAGLLRGRRATVFPTEVANLAAAGVHVQRPGVVTDGNIITASGPDVARAFGMTLVRALSRARMLAHLH
jgi:protease I